MSASLFSPARARVSVLAHSDSHDVSLAICDALRRAGADAHIDTPDPSDAAIVVILSPGILVSGMTLPQPEEFPNSRLVPVSVGGLDQEQIPAALAVLNWIPWHAERAAIALGSVLMACTTDLESYRMGEALLARAEGWDIAGRQAVDLIGKRKQLSASEAALARSGISRSPVLVDFLQASLRETRRLQGRAIRRLAFRVGLTVALVTSAVVVGNQVASMRERSTLEVVASADDVALYPYVNAVKLAALLEAQSEMGDKPSSGTIDRLTGMLSQPWPRSGVFSSPDGKVINDSAPQDDGDVFIIDGGGTIWRIAAGNSTATKVARALDGPGYFLAVDNGAKVFAAADQSKLVILRGSTRSEVTISEAITGLRMDATGGQLAVSVAEGVRLVDMNASSLSPGRLFVNILTSAFVNGRLIGLQRDGKSLDLVDLATGNILRRYADPTGPLSEAAIGPSGDVVVQSADGSLLAAKPDTNLVSTGLWVPDLLNSIAISKTGELLYTPKGWTTRVFDLRRAIPLAEVCRESSALALRLSFDGNWLGCNYGAAELVWNLADIRPVVDSAQVPRMRVAAGDKAASILPSGPLEVSVGGSTHIWDLTGSKARASATKESLSKRIQLHGQLTTLALTPDGSALAVGSSAGEMLVADLAGGELNAVTTWASPDGSPVQAISLSGKEATIVTSTATWRIPVCVQCSQSLDKLVGAVHDRLLPCYPADIRTSVPERLLAKLDVHLCQE